MGAINLSYGGIGQVEFPGFGKINSVTIEYPGSAEYFPQYGGKIPLTPGGSVEVPSGLWFKLLVDFTAEIEYSPLFDNWTIGVTVYGDGPMEANRESWAFTREIVRSGEHKDYVWGFPSEWGSDAWVMPEAQLTITAIKLWGSIAAKTTPPPISAWR